MNTTAGEFELEMGTEVFDLIGEPDANEENSAFDVTI